MIEDRPHYIAYMLRVWQVGGGESAWRASLESPHTGELHVFTDLTELFAFLQSTIEVLPVPASSRRSEL